MIRQRSKVVWVAGGLLIGLWFVLLLLSFGREPTAQGRTLSQWLEALDNPTAVTNVQTITALRVMGGKAAVRLVPMLDASDSPLTLRLVELARNQSLVRIRFAPAPVRQRRAERAFEIMGDQAVAAAPALVSLLVRRGTEPMEYLGDSANRAANALSGLGRGAIPFLRPAVCSQHTRVRYEGISVLRLCASDSAPGTMTEVFKLLDDADPRVRQAGAEAMGWFFGQPELVIPRLARLLGDPNPSVRKQAAYALGRFGSRASNTVAALQQACSDAAPEVRHAAAAALTKVGGGVAVPRDGSEPGPKGKQ